MSARFITFEGTEGGGKTTQIEVLSQRLRSAGRVVRLVREPGGTPIGEEIRHTLKESEGNAGMTAETELLLMNASRAQLVREIIRPALAAGEIVLSDRFFDSTIAYQGYGRGLDLAKVQAIVDLAVGETRPDLTLLLALPVELSEARRSSRQREWAQASEKAAGQRPVTRDRMEEADRGFFQRVEQGFKAIAMANPERVRVIDATRPIEEVSATIWQLVQERIQG